MGQSFNGQAAQLEGGRRTRAGMGVGAAPWQRWWIWTIDGTKKDGYTARSGCAEGGGAHDAAREEFGVAPRLCVDM
jgi:hypothetical protein